MNFIEFSCVMKDYSSFYFFPQPSKNIKLSLIHGPGWILPTDGSFLIQLRCLYWCVRSIKGFMRKSLELLYLIETDRNYFKMYNSVSYGFASPLSHKFLLPFSFWVLILILVITLKICKWYSLALGRSLKLWFFLQMLFLLLFSHSLKLG